VELGNGKIYESTLTFDDQGNLSQSELREKQQRLNQFVVE
jgi:hypothetical protein